MSTDFQKVFFDAMEEFVTKLNDIDKVKYRSILDSLKDKN